MTQWIQFRTIIQSIAVLTGLFFVFLYVAYQARFLITGPQITLLDEPDLRQNARAIVLTGTAVNISRLWLNGRPIFTNPRGQFEAAVILENGYTVTTLTAEDRYGRQTSVIRPFVYSPASFVN